MQLSKDIIDATSRSGEAKPKRVVFLILEGEPDPMDRP